MERLTFEGNFCDISQCIGEHRMTSVCEDGDCDARKVWYRLKEYEDTGLTPEICAEYKKFEDEAVSKGVSFKRIVELMEEESARKNPQPLTEEELRGMIGEPVWVVYHPVGNGEWEVVDEWTLAHMDEFVAYRYKLAKEELE